MGWMRYSCVFEYQRLMVDHSKISVHGRVHIHGLEGFWIYTKKYLTKHNGMKFDKFPLYIKEIEWKYKTRYG